MGSPLTDVSIRPARAEEVGVLHRIIVSAFNLQEGSERWTHMQRVAQGWQSFLVMERKGELVGATRVGRDRLRFGEAAVVLKGEIGYVGIMRELHGQGLGTALMEGAVRFMQENGFHISRLGGLNRFYARFGYVPFPRRYYEFSLGPVGAGASTMTPDVFIAPSDEERARLRPYAPGRDWPQRCRLYDLFNAGRTGAMVESRPPSPQSGGPDSTGLKWIYDDGTGVHAYAFASMTGESVEIHDFAGDFAHPQAMAAVVKRVLWEAVRKGAKQALGRLPHDDRVEQALVGGAVPYTLREIQSAPASNMTRVIALPLLVEAASPEWTRRLATSGAAGWTGVLELQVQGQAARLALSARGVTPAEEGAGPDARLTFGPRGFLLALLGHRDFCEIADQVSGELTPSLANTLRVLFRREPCASGPTG